MQWPEGMALYSALAGAALVLSGGLRLADLWPF